MFSNYNSWLYEVSMTCWWHYDYHKSQWQWLTTIRAVQCRTTSWTAWSTHPPLLNGTLAMQMKKHKLSLLGALPRSTKWTRRHRDCTSFAWVSWKKFNTKTSFASLFWDMCPRPSRLHPYPFANCLDAFSTSSLQPRQVQQVPLSFQVGSFRRPTRLHRQRLLNKSLLCTVCPACALVTLIYCSVLVWSICFVGWVGSAVASWQRRERIISHWINRHRRMN